MFAGFSENIGKGLVAGAVGTAAMTLSSTIEAKLRNRGASTAPADAARTVLGIEKFDSDTAEERFGELVHWAYGTGWGVVRGLLRTFGFKGRLSTLTHLAAVYGTEQVLLPRLDVAPPASEWGAKEIAIDLWHHVVYAVATAAAYERLDRRSRRSALG